MERMAIFVEGQTERMFIEKLIKAMAGRRRLHIDAAHGYGGAAAGAREWREIEISRPDPKTEFYIIIYDSRGDGRVLSDIRDQYATLTNQSYHPIVGVRDIYPLPQSDIPTIRSDFARYIPTGHVIPELILEIMEIEAWFIGEHTHFARMHPSLTQTEVTNRLGYDPSTIDVSTIPAPCDDLRSVYHSVNIGYSKSQRHTERTVSELSYEEVYITLRQRVSELDKLIQLIDDFFMRG
jgi:hypothetical protein